MLNQFWRLPAALIAALGLAALPLAITGCEREGPAERAGEELDEAGEEVEDAFEEIGDDIDDDFRR